MMNKSLWLQGNHLFLEVISLVCDWTLSEMDSGQYVFIMRHFWYQNKFQAHIEPYLTAKKIQPDTLTNHVCAR